MATARVNSAFALHALSADEAATCGTLVEAEESARLTLMPTHHVGEFGDLSGFRLCARLIVWIACCG